MKLEITDKDLERLQDIRNDDITKICDSGVKLSDLVSKYGEDAYLELYIPEYIDCRSSIDISIRYKIFETDEQYRTRIQRLQDTIEKNKIKRKKQIVETIQQLEKELESLN